MKQVQFNPKNVTKIMLKDLPERSRDVIEKRFGLKGGSKLTLEAIGEKYEITRERVRQIETLAKDLIRKGEAYNSHAQSALLELREVIDSFGGLAEEKHLLETAAGNDKDSANHIYLLLELGEDFYPVREDENFHKSWYTREENHSVVKKTLGKLYENLDTHEIVTSEDIVTRFMDTLEHDRLDGVISEAQAERLLKLSKKIGSNKLGGWGRTESQNIRTRGIRDFAYLVLREVNEPMHFETLAAKTGEYFGKNINIATLHNEVIKDPRFVLVGRGMYGLDDWGWYGGTVSELITEILKKDKKLTAEEVIDKVKERKMVKTSTIIINLKNKKLFVYDKAKKIYSLVK